MFGKPDQGGVEGEREACVRVRLLSMYAQTKKENAIPSCPLSFPFYFPFPPHIPNRQQRTPSLGTSAGNVSTSSCAMAPQT